MTTPDIEFYWDPVCPFAWITSRWVHEVVARTGYSVDWRFISLRILNKDKDYATEFPAHYERGHTAGLRMLRVAAMARAEHGRQHMADLYTAYGESIWDRDAGPEDGADAMADVGTAPHIVAVLERVGLPAELADAADDPAWDPEIEADTVAALAHTGRDVGTPLIVFQPPDGPSFFGPVISRVPKGEDAVKLWESVITLATWPGFAELKRSLREVPQLRLLGGRTEEVAPAHEDWEHGHRRQG